LLFQAHSRCVKIWFDRQRNQSEHSAVSAFWIHMGEQTDSAHSTIQISRKFYAA
jgi:hypothetical protein